MVNCKVIAITNAIELLQKCEWIDEPKNLIYPLFQKAVLKLSAT